MLCIFAGINCAENCISRIPYEYVQYYSAECIFIIICLHDFTMPTLLHHKYIHHVGQVQRLTRLYQHIFYIGRSINYSIFRILRLFEEKQIPPYIERYFPNSKSGITVILIGWNSYTKLTHNQNNNMNNSI